MKETQAAAGSRPRILIVDDEELLRDVLAENLRNTYQVETAGSTAEADVHMGSMHFDLVLADHVMPGEMGLDFLVRVRERFPDTKRILITGYLKPDLISRAENLAELSAYMIKPISAKQLHSAVAEALAA
ncbi:response regulator [Opitutaceae bacterium]|nr:response regulator [Opitutaceae bacterium]